MAQEYFLGRVGGARIWAWRTAPIPPGTDTGINGFTRRRPWTLLLGEPTGARAYVWNGQTFRATRLLTIATGGARIFRRRGMPLV